MRLFEQQRRDRRWGRSLRLGDRVTLMTEPPIRPPAVLIALL